MNRRIALPLILALLGAFAPAAHARGAPPAAHDPPDRHGAAHVAPAPDAGDDALSDALDDPDDDLLALGPGGIARGPRDGAMGMPGGMGMGMMDDLKLTDAQKT